MGTGLRAEIVLALAWLSFPMVPVLLEELHYQFVVNLFGAARSGPDPYDWQWGTWLAMVGPLLGYGFLAGATADVPDPPPRSGLRRIVGRRAVWVAIGPWAGPLLLIAGFLSLWLLNSLLPAPSGNQAASQGEESWIVKALTLAWIAALFGVFALGWLWPAWAALRRARRVGRLGRAIRRGVVTALTFVGSLFGGFWAVTSAWRGYFFDPRMMPMIVAALSLAAMSGCSATLSYGEYRRRELFHAMLPAWVFGLALMWWWASRRGRGGPRSS